MSLPDLNLLVTLDVLLAEGSVAGAARRLQLSPSAMSRALARLRVTTGDPLLVRAGRDLVPTPRALELRDEVARLVEGAGAVLRPSRPLDPRQIDRTFALRSREGFVETFGPALLARLDDEAPGLRLRFLHKPDKDSAPLREGGVDFETGIVTATSGPELRTQALFRDRFVVVVRPDHPLARAPLTPEAYASARHVHVARRAREGQRGGLDEALEALGLARRVACTVDSFASALSLARATDLVASVPERHTAALRDGLCTLSLPVDARPFTLSLLWHPRMEGDQAHRWLRGVIRDVCRSGLDDDLHAGSPADTLGTTAGSDGRAAEV
jgi:DNA-binding transcriptional LysR family regulator